MNEQQRKIIKTEIKKLLRDGYRVNGPRSSLCVSIEIEEKITSVLDGWKKHIPNLLNDALIEEHERGVQACGKVEPKRVPWKYMGSEITRRLEQNQFRKNHL